MVKSLEELLKERRNLYLELIAGYMILEFRRNNTNLIQKMVDNRKGKFFSSVEEYKKITSDYTLFSEEVDKYFYFCIKEKTLEEYGNPEREELLGIAKRIFAENKYLPEFFNAEEFLILRKANQDKNFNEFLIDFSLKTQAYEFLNYLKKNQK